ncbi:MAG: hypothetical protein RLZZ369_590 [Pseudomonadota bacterium]
MATFKQSDVHLLALLNALAPFRGGKCLAATVLALTRELGVRLAFVAERRGDMAHALAMADRQDLKQPFFYDPKPQPCRAVLNGEVLSVPCNVSQLYAGNEGFQSYFGVPLKNEQGQVIGLLAVMDVHPFDREKVISDVLMPLAPRIAAELECAAIDE